LTDEIRDIGSREFQVTYPKIKDPVRVVARNETEPRVIGFFFPGPLDPRIQTGEWPRHEESINGD